MMTTLLVAYGAGVAAFVAVDGLWLGVVARRFYAEKLAAFLTPQPNWLAAGLFYLFYVAMTVFLVVRPALATGGLKAAAINGAALGACAYATYELTNLATLRDWPKIVVVVDIVWGAVLTAAVSVASTAAARAYAAR